MFENQKIELETILEELTKLEKENTYEKINLDELIKTNKYLKQLNETFFEKEANIPEQIKTHSSLVKELKENYIKLTQEQKELEKKQKEYLSKAIQILKLTLGLIKKIENQNQYIDSEIMDILKINTIEEIKQVIKYNKNIDLKRKGITKQTDQVIIEEIINYKTITKPIVKEEKQETSENKEEIEEIEEKVLVFNTKEEITNHLKKNYNIEIKTEKSIEELNDILEIIENYPFENLKKETIKEILEKANFRLLNELKYILIESKIQATDIEHIEKIFIEEEEPQFITKIILLNTMLKREEKIEILKQTESRRKKIIKNMNTLYAYGIKNMSTDVTIRELSIEKIDQLIEAGHYEQLHYIKHSYNKKIIKNEQLEDYLEKNTYGNIYIYFFGTELYGIPYIKEKNKDINQYTNEIHKKLKEDKRFNISPLLVEPNLKQLTSTNKILKEAEEASKKSIDNFLKTINSPLDYDNNDIFKINNPYFKIIEEKYTKPNSIVYGIPISKAICKSGYILISRPKVLRLLNQYITDKHEITEEIVKQCMLYNIITTDEIINEIERILKNDFEIVQQKIKKY